MKPWAADFALSFNTIKVHRTGAVLTVNWTLIAECLIWFNFFLIVAARMAWMRFTARPGPTIWFAPDRPRPWYLLWSAAGWGNLRLAATPIEAEVAFHFHDSTWSPAAADTHARQFNFACRDVSKTHVARVFGEVFGYPLLIDPTTWSGPAVEKSETNGDHSGRVIDCPVQPRDGSCYQRLVDTAQGGFIHDLRTPCVGGRPVVVLTKKKPADDRFSIHNRSVTLSPPEQIYSPEELADIGRFCAAMGLDWGSLDILRDRPTGRIYIVDVNKTDVGPVIALSLADKLKSTALLAAALKGLVEGASNPPAG
ncbi:MAG: hypothetical protein JWP35_4641 [Caulobacter sp.]|nr:hypothetical protein [Caulobacter sp.]